MSIEKGRAYFRQFGMEDRVKLSPMDPKAYNIVSLDSQEFRFYVGAVGQQFFDCLAAPVSADN